MKKKPLKFGVIETRYDGYKFRSRLEARWATFFNTLGIKYEYEKEGYDLEGTWYLPDFWLPEYNRFVEIKPTTPTDDEQFKARQLAIYTNNQVQIFAGNIGLPDEDCEESPYEIYLYEPPALNARAYDEEGHTIYRALHTTPEMISLLQKLDDISMVPSVSMGSLLLELRAFCHGSKDITRYRAKLQKASEGLVELAPLIETYKDELYTLANLEDGWFLDFRGIIDLDRLVWLECTQCAELRTGGGIDQGHYKCPAPIKGNLIHNTDRLIAAYTAAREARF